MGNTMVTVQAPTQQLNYNHGSSRCQQCHYSDTATIQPPHVPDCFAHTLLPPNLRRMGRRQRGVRLHIDPHRGRGGGPLPHRSLPHPPRVDISARHPNMRWVMPRRIILTREWNHRLPRACKPANHQSYPPPPPPPPIHLTPHPPTPPPGPSRPLMKLSTHAPTVHVDVHTQEEAARLWWRQSSPHSSLSSRSICKEHTSSSATSGENAASEA